MTTRELIEELEVRASRGGSAQTPAGKRALTRERNAYLRAIKEIRKAERAARAFSAAYSKWLEERRKRWDL